MVLQEVLCCGEDETEVLRRRVPLVEHTCLFFLAVVCGAYEGKTNAHRVGDGQGRTEKKTITTG